MTPQGESSHSHSEPATLNCRVCKLDLPIECFTRNARNLTGRENRCKECTIKYYVDLRNRHLEARGIATSKICRSCKIEKPVSQFYKADWSPDGFAVVCRECVSVQSAERWKRNPRDPDVNRRKAREWHATNRDYVRLKHRFRYEQNSEEQKRKSVAWRTNNIEKARATARERNHRNWERHATWNCRSRAKRKGVPFFMQPEDLFDSVTGKLPEFCPIFPNLRLDYEGGPDRRRWPSVDRKVPELGYVKGNVWVISTAANMWKSNGSNPEERRRIASLMGVVKKPLANEMQQQLFSD